MADEYVIRRGDHGVQMTFFLRDADGNPTSIAGASLKFNLGPAAGGDALFSNDATNEEDDGGDEGEGSYTWQQADTAELDPGVYLGEVRATFTSPAARQTFPNASYILVRVTREVSA